ncbi:TPA: hypothetical protein QB629_000860 [Pasteurella multocida]|nr:hypothetical protein [Pasteurella multocida]HDR1345833.1 hypothetical protein [Pasteurella multocida]HDR1887448.1 hypothetical protein [Pasteurella multocida]
MIKEPYELTAYNSQGQRVLVNYYSNYKKANVAMQKLISAQFSFNDISEIRINYINGKALGGLK